MKDRHVNDYIQSIIGKDFTAKDFRTWAGTLLCSIALAMQGQGTSKTERKRRVRKAIAATAEQLGNTPAVCRSSYICPRLLDEYMEGKPFEMLRKTRKGSPVVRVGLSMEEKALLKFLRETIADRRTAILRDGAGVDVAVHETGAWRIRRELHDRLAAAEARTSPRSRSWCGIRLRVLAVEPFREVPVELQAEEVEGDAQPTEALASTRRPSRRKAKGWSSNCAAPMSKKSTPRICWSTMTGVASTSISGKRNSKLAKPACCPTIVRNS